MKKILALLILGVVCGLTACQREETFRPDAKAVASLETMTRTQLLPEGSLYKVLWRTGDRIAVTDGATIAHYTADAGGAATAVFSPEGTSTLYAGPYTAWYPASIADGFLPAEQTYQPGGVVEVPMSATSDALDFAFRNLCGFIRMDVATPLTDVRLDRIVVTADQPLSGAFTRNGESAVITEGEGVRLNCDGVALGSEAKSFYISVPANTYTGLKLVLYTTDGRSQCVALKNDATYRVERSEVCEISLVAGDFEAVSRTSAQLRPAGDFNHTIKELSGTKRQTTNIDSVITRVVFDTGSRVNSGRRLDTYDSPQPIWVNYDPATTTVTVSTPADEICTGKMASYMFSHLYALEEIVNLQCLNTSQATMMNNMFTHAGTYGKRPLELDLSHFDTHGVVSFLRMFQYCATIETLDLRSFDTSQAETMDNMFAHCYNLKNLDVSSFNTAKVTNFRSLFNRCNSLKEINLDNFDTRAGTLMTYMFYSMASVEKISIRGFNINRSTANIGYMFQVNPNLKELNVGDGFRKGDEMSLPSSFFTVAAEKDGTRTASNSGTLTIHCTAASAAWLARTNLRWVHSGYRNATPITVNFIDESTGTALSPTWAVD